MKCGTTVNGPYLKSFDNLIFDIWLRWGVKFVISLVPGSKLWLLLIFRIRNFSLFNSFSEWCFLPVSKPKCAKVELQFDWPNSFAPPTISFPFLRRKKSMEERERERELGLNEKKSDLGKSREIKILEMWKWAWRTLFPVQKIGSSLWSNLDAVLMKYVRFTGVTAVSRPWP